MSKVKQATDQIECHFCGQLWFISELQQVCLADGPDDFITVGMCDECAEECEKHFANREDGCEDDYDDEFKEVLPCDKYNEDDTQLVDAWLENDPQFDFISDPENVKGENDGNGPIGSKT